MKLTSTLKMCLGVLTIFCNASTFTYAAVIMTGTRIIFPADQNEKTIHLQNKDNAPNIVQVWVDEGNEASTPDNTNAPFIANPQIFKIAPKQGQIIRLIFTGNKSTLPTDRESIFYFNFSEIPASKTTNADKNKLMVVFKNRLKILYRPQRLAIQSHEIASLLSYSINSQSSKITVKNNSPYYANIAELSMSLNGKKSLIQKNIMVAPFSTGEWSLPVKNVNTSHAKVSINLINDYGVITNNELKAQSE